MKLRICESGQYAKVRRRIDQIGAILDKSDIPMSLREIHYKMVKLGLYPNTRQNYESLSSWATKGREAGLLDWDKIVDDTREAVETPWWSSIKDAVSARIENYRSDRWKDSPYHVELWIEKRTMLRTVGDIADEYAIPMICGAGFNSTSAIWEAIRRLVAFKAKQIHILYCGDFDPSGSFMDEDIETRLRAFGQRLDLHFHRVLLNLDQIEGLPQAFEVRAKKSSGEVYDKLQADSRAKKMIEKYGKLVQVEVEAMEPEAIRGLVRDSIQSYLPSDYGQIVKREERHRKAMMRKVA